MKTFNVTVRFICNADHSPHAVQHMQTCLNHAGFKDYRITNAEEVLSPLNVYLDAKAAFYTQVEADGSNLSASKAATAYLDAAIKALHQRQLDTTQLLSVWQDVKGYL